jgi:hypothetical protein
MEIKQLKTMTHDKILQLRSIEVIIKQPAFETLYNSLDEMVRTEVEIMILLGNKKELKHWLDNCPYKEVSEFTIKRLKRLAKELGVAHYSRLSKLELLKGVKDAIEQSSKANGNGNDDKGDATTTSRSGD